MSLDYGLYGFEVRVGFVSRGIEVWSLWLGLGFAVVLGLGLIPYGGGLVHCSEFMVWGSLRAHASGLRV